MNEYLKINSLFKRDKNTKRLIIDEYACEEFASIDRWIVTEKVDGCNIRIIYEKKDNISTIKFGGRTDNAELPPELFSWLQDHFDVYKFQEIFPEAQYVILYGEGYGGKIQAGGWYDKEVNFILFDVKVGYWWLQQQDVAKIAGQFGIKSVPILASGYEDSIIWTTYEIVQYVKSQPLSLVAQVEKRPMEGIVARSYPQMLSRLRCDPIMFKLRCEDMLEKSDA